MPDIWTIKGEAGKAIDDTVRTLDALRVSGLEFEFSTLEDDVATWNVWLRSTEEISQFVPEIGQQFSFFKNGDRFFAGHVTGRVPSFSPEGWGYIITVSGPWYWLARTPISSEIPDATTAVQERGIYLFDTGSPDEHLISIATRAIELGMPISLGTFASCHDVPRLSLREMSIADAITEIMRLAVDGHVYFDHSGPDGTFPMLCMQRRSSASTVDVDIEDKAVPSLTLKPRYDLRISELQVNFADRATHGNKRVTEWRRMTAGTASGGLPDRQIITVTGPELTTMLPQDLTDFVVVQSSAIAGDIGGALSIWHDLLKAGEADIADVTVYESANSDTVGGTTTLWPTDPMVIATDNEGNDLDLAEWPYYLTKGEIKTWWEKDGIESVQARITAAVASHLIAGVTEDAPAPPKWARVLGATQTSHFLLDGGELKVRYVWQANVSTVVPLVKTLWATDTTLIRQEDWGWFHPPEGFADWLLETQNWLPWEGEVPIATDESPPNNVVGSVLNISGWVPETADMRAMIAGYRVKPSTGQISFRLNPPARPSYRDLVSRFRQSGADNIYWLSAEGGGPDPGGPPEGSILHEDGTTWEVDEDGTTTITENS